MTHPLTPSARLYRIFAALVEVGWLAAVVLVPLAVNPWGLNYELPKVALLRALTLLMLAAHLLALAWSPRPPDPRRWLRRPLVRPVLLVVIASLLSTLTSISPLVSLRGSYHRQQGFYLSLCLVLWALLVAARLRTPAQRRRLVTTIVVTGSLVALTPLVRALLQGQNPLTGRPGGTLGNPIFLGAYLIMVIPFTLARLVGQDAITYPAGSTGLPYIRRAGWGLALTLQLFALLVTQSRGPWIGALTGLVLFATLTLWRSRRRWVLTGLLAVPLLIGGLVVGLNFGLTPLTRFSQLPYVRRVVLPQGLSGGTVRVRLVLWQAAGQVVTTWPEVGLSPDRLRALRPLLGYGPDTAVVVYAAAYPPELAHIQDPDAIWDRAHNEVLDLLAMQGCLGVTVYLVLGIACARRGLALWRAAPDASARVWAAAPLAALVAHVVEIQFAFSMTTTSLVVWLCVAWLAASSSTLSRILGEGGGWEESESRRWRFYAIAGALTLTFVAVRLEASALWADTLAARARTLDRTGRWDESIALYDRALDLVPWQATFHQFRAEAFFNLAHALPEDQTALQDELLAAADRSLARARALEPLEASYYSNAGVLHAYWSEAVDPAHLETAVNLYRQAFRLAPTQAELRTDLGHVYHNHGRYVEALDQYRAALEIDPQFAAAHYDAGLAWLALGRQDLAREAFQAALDLTPDCVACQDALHTLQK